MKSVKLALLGATFLVGAAASANAADVYSRGGSLKDTAPAAYMPAITWTGFYIGAHVGSTLDDTTTADFEDVEVEFENEETWLAGAHIGYNWQTARNVVFGIEGDVSVPFDSDDFGADYLASIRGRLGYAFGSSLIYGTGGVAFAGFEDDFGDDDTITGWVAGVGFEHKLRQNVSLGLEGLYYDFEDEDVLGFDVERDFWSVRARLNFHLGGHGDGLK